MTMPSMAGIRRALHYAGGADHGRHHARHAGKHVVNLFGGHAPYTLKGGDWATEKENFRKTVFDTIEEYAPGFRDDVIEAQLLVAPDIENIVSLPQGHIFHGELSTDQLFFQRPVSGYADYRTPR